MDRDETKHFKEQCALYLTQLSLTDLRTYGRFLNLTAPTRLKKSILIDEIISVLCGEKSPTRTKRGAPIKSKLFQADIPLKIEEIKNKILNKNQLNINETPPRDNQYSTSEFETNNSTINLNIQFEKLNKKQKQLLINFLNSL